MTAKIYVLCSHAIETAKLLLNSPWYTTKKNPSGETVKTVANSSDQVGRNLMDHIICIRWGSAENPVYPFRGPLSTSGIGDFRDGKERKKQAAFRIENGNVGWNWGGGAPQKTVVDIMRGRETPNNKLGTEWS